MSERRALVTGGTGRVGRAIAARLEAEDFRVLAAGRADGDVSRTPDALALVERAVAELAERHGEDGAREAPVQLLECIAVTPPHALNEAAVGLGCRHGKRHIAG